MNAAVLAAALALPPAAPPAALPLAERFSAAVTLSPAASPEERALFAEAVRLTLGTETGRSLAERYLAGGLPCEVRFEELSGIGGKAESSASGDRAVLARGILGWKPGWAGLLAARTFAHEVLGHILSHQRARAAGVSFEFSATLDDEVNAAVIGYLVELEAGWRFLDPDAELLLSDRAAYEAALLTRQPEYALTLREEELDAPVRALKERLAEFSVTHPHLVADLPGRLAHLESHPAPPAALAAYKSHPFRAAVRAEVAARVERLRAIAPPPPGLQSPGG